IRKDIISSARKVLRKVIGETGQQALGAFIENYFQKIQPKFSSNTFSESTNTYKNVVQVAAAYQDDSQLVDARLILRDNFDVVFSKYPEALMFGEDSGSIGDVNQGLAGLQEKFGAT